MSAFAGSNRLAEVGECAANIHIVLRTGELGFCFCLAFRKGVIPPEGDFIAALG